MACLRCHGLLLQEHRSKRGAWWWRCVNCGELVDRVILRNRAEQEADLAFRREAMERERHEWADWLGRVPAATDCA
jgi:hypothetical protein